MYDNIMNMGDTLHGIQLIAIIASIEKDNLVAFVLGCGSTIEFNSV